MVPLAFIATSLLWPHPFLFELKWKCYYLVKENKYDFYIVVVGQMEIPKTC